MPKVFEVQVKLTYVIADEPGVESHLKGIVSNYIKTTATFQELENAMTVVEKETEQKELDTYPDAWVKRPPGMVAIKDKVLEDIELSTEH